MAAEEPAHPFHETLGAALAAFAVREHIRPSLLIDPIVTLVRRENPKKWPAYSGDRGALGAFPVAVSHGDYNTAAHLFKRMLTEKRTNWLVDAIVVTMKANAVPLLLYILSWIDVEFRESLTRELTTRICNNLVNLSDPEVVIKFMTFLMTSRIPRQITEVKRDFDQKVRVFVLLGNFDMIVSVMNFTRCYSSIYTEVYFRPRISHETFKQLVDFLKDKIVTDDHDQTFKAILELYLLAIFTGDIRNISFLEEYPGLIGNFFEAEGAGKEFAESTAVEMSVLSNSPDVYNWVVNQVDKFEDIDDYTDTNRLGRYGVLVHMIDNWNLSHLCPSPEMLHYVASQPDVVVATYNLVTLMLSPLHVSAVLQYHYLPVSAFIVGMDEWTPESRFEGQPVLTREEYDQMLVDLLDQAGIDLSTVDSVLIDMVIMSAMLRRFRLMLDRFRPFAHSEVSEKWFKLYDADPSDPRIHDPDYDVTVENCTIDDSAYTIDSGTVYTFHRRRKRGHPPRSRGPYRTESSESSESDEN